MASFGRIIFDFICLLSPSVAKNSFEQKIIRISPFWLKIKTKGGVTILKEWNLVKYQRYQKNETSGFDSATKVHHFSFSDCCHSHWRSYLDRHFWRSLSFFLLFYFLPQFIIRHPFLISVSFSLYIMSDLKSLFYIEFKPLNLIYRIFDWWMYVFEIAL